MVQHLDNINQLPDLANEKSLDIIETYVREVSEAVNTERQQPIGRDINSFFPLVHAAIKSKQNVERIADDKQVLFVEEDPPEKLDTETITFVIQERRPGQYGRGPAGANTHKEVSHHYRSIVDHPDHIGEKLVTIGKFYDNWVKFNIYARTNKQVRERGLWFSKLMSSYNWYFKASGFLVIEEGMGDRQRMTIDTHEVTTYSLLYYVRSEDVSHFSSQELKKVSLYVKATSELTS